MISGGLDGVLRVWNDETNQLHAERNRGQASRIWKLIYGQGSTAAISSVERKVFLFEL
jgi:hypothetical protein